MKSNMRRLLIFLDIITLILIAVLGIVFVFSYTVITSPIKYLFLIGAIILVGLFYKSLCEFDKDQGIVVIKNSKRIIKSRKSLKKVKA